MDSDVIKFMKGRVRTSDQLLHFLNLRRWPNIKPPMFLLWGPVMDVYIPADTPR